MKYFKVAGKSDPKKIAGAIIHALDTDVVELQAVGSLAVNVAVKALIHARSFASEVNKDIDAVPSFEKFSIGDDEKTGIKFSIAFKK